jgi:hypothetical protein
VLQERASHALAQEGVGGSHRLELGDAPAEGPSLPRRRPAARGDTGPLKPGQSFAYTFKAPGEYFYNECASPRSTGKVVVYAPGASGRATASAAVSVR